MTPQQIVGLGSRLLAIWCAISALQTFSIMRVFPTNANTGATNGVAITIIAIYTVAAAVLWLFPMAIAHKLIPRTQYQDTLTVQGRQAVTVAIVVLGFAIIAFKAMTPLAYYLLMLGYNLGNGQTIRAMEVSENIAGGVGLIELLAGLAMVTKARQLAARIGL